MVTSLRGPSPRTLYQQDYCSRGQAENLIKQLKVDLKSDRTSASSFLANFARLLFTAAAYVLHQQLRHLGLQGTSLATAQPRTVMLTLFKIATASNSTRAGATASAQRLPGHGPAGAGLRTTLPCQTLASRARSAMIPPRLAHETMPTILPINDFTRFTPPAGKGEAIA